MLEMIKARREQGEKGFTLAELLIVVAIIAVLIAIAITCSNFFRSIGKPWLAVFSSGSRFSVFFIPAIYFLPRVFGVFGVLVATPVCEFCSAVFALLLLKREMRRLGRLIREEKNRKLLAGVEYP